MKRGWITAFLSGFAAFCLIRYAAAVGDGVRAGLSNCASLLIPSLFPFLVLASLIGASSAGQRLSDLVWHILHPLTGLPRSIGAAFLMSFLGGFPVGARMLSNSLEKGGIDADTAAKALCCCVNAGPSFLVCTAGAMLRNQAAGFLLLGAQILSSLCICAWQFHGRRKIRAPAPLYIGRKENGFVESVRSAAAGMFGICAFVIVFSALTALLEACGFFSVVCMAITQLFPVEESVVRASISGILEVTNGCIAASSLQGHIRILLCAFFVSFSSCSIIFQVKSCFSTQIDFRPFYFSRLFHGALTCLFTFFGIRFLPPSILSAAAIAGTPIPQGNTNTYVTSFCLMAMCSILLLTPPTGNKGNLAQISRWK